MIAQHDCGLTGDFLPVEKVIFLVENGDFMVIERNFMGWHEKFFGIYPLVMTNSLLLKIAI